MIFFSFSFFSFAACQRLGQQVLQAHVEKDQSICVDMSDYAQLLSLYTNDIWWGLCTLYLLACQVRVTAGDSALSLRLCEVFRVLINSLVW